MTSANLPTFTRSRLFILLPIFFVLMVLRLLILPVTFDIESNKSNQFDYKNNASYTAARPVKADSGPPRLDSGEAGYFLGLRTFLADKLDTLYPSDEANLVKGLLLGVNDFSKEVKQQFINTGTIHVVVVSGYNVSLVAGAILASTLIFGRKMALGLSFLGIILYTLLTGAQPPTVRAAIMGSLAFGATGLGRQKESLELLFIASGLMLLVDPSLFLNLSFELSVLATLGVIYFTPKFEGKLKPFGPLRGDLANTLAAQMLVTPLLMLNFGQISWISPLVNLLILWTVPITTILGFFSLLMGLIVGPLGQVISWFNYLFLAFFLLVVKTFSSVPVLKVQQGNYLIVLGYLMVLIGILTWKKVRSPDGK